MTVFAFCTLLSALSFASTPDGFREQLAAAARGYVSAPPTTPPPPTDPYADFTGFDCEDGIPNPNAQELCDGVDNDCDGEIDEDLETDTYYLDSDEDGYGDPDRSVDSCYQPWGYVTDDSDCDDDSDENYPGADEVCDGADNDCDGLIDADDDGADLSTGSTYFRDSDGDGYGNWDDTTFSCGLPDGYLTDASDCDDTNAANHPGAEELCDGVDNDCDNRVDDGVTPPTWYLDSDGDGHGGTRSTSACTQPSGYVSTTGDCDNTRDDIYPGATDGCDGDDNDCDGAVDEDAATSSWYADGDGDGYGAGAATLACAQPYGTVSTSSDCDDADRSIYPGAEEVCDSHDNDCDGTTDEADATDAAVWHADSDGDGYGAPGATTEACNQPSGYTSDSTDCDDTNAAINPGAAEVCNTIDDDCDGAVDGDDGAADTTFYADADGDGFGDAGDTADACEAPDGHVEDDTDCDDRSGAVYPGAAEVCNDQDDDCDGSIDEGLATAIWYTDADGDGFGDPGAPVEDCAQPGGTVSNDDDPDDTDPQRFPEICDGLDNDGDGERDEGFSRSTWYPDEDGDGYGDASDAGVLACARPPRHIDENTDCNDASADAYPGALELCDEIDNDCNGEVDTDAPASSFALTFTGGMLRYVDTDTGEVTTHSGPYEGISSNSAIAGNPLAGRMFVNGSQRRVYELDTETGTATHVFTSSTGVCGMALDENENLFGLNGSDRLYYFDLDAGTTTVIGNLGVDINHCGLVYSSRNQVLYGLTITPNTTYGAIVRIDPETGEADVITELSTAYSWRSAGITYDEINDQVYIVSRPGVFRVDLDPALSGGDNVELVTDELQTNNLTFFTTGQNASRYYTDSDGDGYGDPDDYVDSCDWPEGTVTIPADCDDTSADAYPFADEVCDGADNDCDGTVDEGVEADTWYADADGDGLGDPDAAVEACEQPAGYTDNPDDCDDTDDSVGAESAWYADVDADGYGDAADSTVACSAPDGFVADDADCDDTLSSVNPGMEEACDELDNNCDDQIDEGVTVEAWVDADRDGHGDPALPVDVCVITDGYAATDEDCDDGDRSASPDGVEACDGVDNDCDGMLDDGYPAKDFYADADIDGYGDATDTIAACAAPDGYVTDDTDCDDSTADAYPGATELCNEADDDCDGVIDNDLPDADSSGEADCNEIAVVVSRQGARNGQRTDCGGNTALELELGALEDALAEMDLSMITFYEGSRGLDYEDIEPYPVVVYHTMSWTRSGDALTARAIVRAAEDGKGLVLLGDDFTRHAEYFADAGEPELAALAAISRSRSNGRNGEGAERANDEHDVLDGAWGEVGDFDYYGDIDRTEVTSDAEPLLYIEGRSQLAAWAVEGISQRTVAMVVNVYASQQCEVSDEAGHADLHMMFQNAVWWTGRY